MLLFTKILIVALTILVMGIAEFLACLEDEKENGTFFSAKALSLLNMCVGAIVCVLLLVYYFGSISMIGPVAGERERGVHGTYIRYLYCFAAKERQSIAGRSTYAEKGRVA